MIDSVIPVGIRRACDYSFRNPSRKSSVRLELVVEAIRSVPPLSLLLNSSNAVLSITTRGVAACSGVYVDVILLVMNSVADSGTILYLASPPSGHIATIVFSLPISLACFIFEWEECPALQL